MQYTRCISLPQAVVGFDLQKQKSVKPGQIYAALNRVTQEYDRLRSEALIVSPVLPLPTPNTLLLALVNARSLQ